MNVYKLIYTLCHTAASDKFYPHRVPQNETAPWPCVVYNAVGSSPQNTKSDTVTVDEQRFQLTVFATTYNGACTLAQSMRTILENYPRPQMSATVSGVTIQQVFLNFETDGVMVDEAGNPAYDGLYSRIQDYTIRINNS